VEFFRYPPDHPVATVLAGFGSGIPLLISADFLRYIFEHGGLESILRQGVIGEGVLVYGLLTLGYGVTLFGVLAWHRPWIYALSYPMLWTPFFWGLAVYGVVAPGAILFVGPLAFGFPLWILDAKGSARGLHQWISARRNKKVRPPASLGAPTTPANRTGRSPRRGTGG